MHVVGGVGDLYGLLRGDMPVRPQSRTQVLEARAGESEYTHYDRAIAAETVRWLRTEALGQSKPWALFVSFASPHFPLIVPDRYLALYPPDSVPLPVQWQQHAWPRHPVLDLMRRQQALDEPFDETTLRRAIAVYYGMVTFLDDQIGLVLGALREAGLEDSTRIIYTSDHGEMLGEHGLWWKSCMYEASVGVPLIVAGSDVPAGKVCRTNVSLVDCFPSILEATGVAATPEDADLPGESLWQLARDETRPRIAFSEYHAIFSPSAIFMLRDGTAKYVHYVGHPPQLFDVAADPNETRDLAADPAHAGTLAACEARLRALCDPDHVDRQAKAAQHRLLDAAGGPDTVLAGGVKIPYTPAPVTFGNPHGHGGS